MNQVQAMDRVGQTIEERRARNERFVVGATLAGIALVTAVFAAAERLAPERALPSNGPEPAFYKRHVEHLVLVAMTGVVAFAGVAFAGFIGLRDIGRQLDSLLNS